MSNQSALPIWVQYVQALGPVVVALVAAGIATLIQYRQWKLGNDKLRFDLFERRLRIYNAVNRIKAEFNIDDDIRISIRSILTDLSGYEHLFHKELSNLLGSIESTLILMASDTDFKQKNPKFDLHRAIINHLAEIQELTNKTYPLFLKHLKFQN